jgi:hypothetical protein
MKRGRVVVAAIAVALQAVIAVRAIGATPVDPAAEAETVIPVSTSAVMPLLRFISVNDEKRVPAGGIEWCLELARVRAVLGDGNGTEHAASHVTQGPYVPRAKALAISARAAKERQVPGIVSSGQNGVDLEACVELVRAELTAGRLTQARHIARDLGTSYGNRAWLLIARATGDKADYRLSQLRFSPDPDDYARLVADAEAKARCGDVQAAIDSAGKIRADVFAAVAMWRIARAQALGGDIPGAKRTASRIDQRASVDEFNQAWASIAAALAAQGDIAGTKAALANVVTTTDSPAILALVTYPRSRGAEIVAAKAAVEELKKQGVASAAAVSTGYGLIARAQYDLGDIPGAQATLEATVKWLGTLQNSDDQAWAAMRALQATVFGPRVVEMPLRGISD